VGRWLGIPDSARPYFFFSYSNADYDDWIDRFLTMLDTAVAKTAGYAGEKMHYRDATATNPDARWQPPLFKALAEDCQVLVALCTPTYFREKPAGMCYCGREVSVFLRRSGGVTHGNHVNVVPVLWLIDDLPERGMIPNMVPETLHGLDWRLCRDPQPAISLAKLEKYKKKGLRSVWVNSALSTKDNIVDDLARWIIKLAKTPPSTLTSVDIGSEDCIFHPGEILRRHRTTAPAGAVPQTAGGRSLTLIYVDKDQVPPHVQDLIESVGMHDLSYDVDTRDWSVGLGIDALEKAVEKKRATILVTPSSSLAAGPTRTELEKLATRGAWMGGVLQLGTSAELPSAPGVTVRTAADRPSREDVRRRLSDLFTEVQSTLQRLAPPDAQVPPGRSVPRL
jgi:hypothetical protein